MNSVTLVGTIGREPVSILTPVGNKVEFTMSTQGTSRNEWHNVVYYGSHLNLKNGDLCIVIGRIRTRSFMKEDRKTYFTEVVADTVGKML